MYEHIKYNINEKNMNDCVLQQKLLFYIAMGWENLFLGWEYKKRKKRNSTHIYIRSYHKLNTN